MIRQTSTISVVCIHDSANDQFSSYLEKDFNKLWPILEQADMLITWNGDHFDIPILNKYYPGDLTKIKKSRPNERSTKDFGTKAQARQRRRSYIK